MNYKRKGHRGRHKQKAMDNQSCRCQGNSISKQIYHGSYKLARLFREILESVEPDAVDDALQSALRPEAIAATMNAYFAHYLFEQFCRVAYDRLVAKVGDVRADAFLSEIRRYITAKVREEGAIRDLSRINWNSSEGSALANGIFENVLTIFGGGD